MLFRSDDGQPYDLVCLDIMMPGMDGHEVLDGLRDLERQHGISGLDAAKVVMTTALRDSKHCIRAFEQGCESYYTKPIEKRSLLQQVAELLGEMHAASVPEPQALRNARYLIVDDDGVCRALMKDILSPFGQCTFAYDGQEAVDSVRLALEDGRPYDLITLDIMMPGMNGHDALRGIRALEAARGIRGSDGVKVIMTTALRDSKHCIQSFREGCESYVTKPVDEGQLLDKMRELGWNAILGWNAMLGWKLYFHTARDANWSVAKYLRHGLMPVNAPRKGSLPPRVVSILPIYPAESGGWFCYSGAFYPAPKCTIITR